MSNVYPVQEKPQAKRLVGVGATEREPAKLVSKLRVCLAHSEQLQLTTRPTPALSRQSFGSYGFASCENIAWLIEMGYELYTKSRSSNVRDMFSSPPPDHSAGSAPVGMPLLTAWADTTAGDYFTYPVNLALAHYQLWRVKVSCGFVHYGDTDVTYDLQSWFQTSCNGRQ